ncbi:hypothetical protein RI129_009660 [Pyrocoelia pectoralis]|uniref:Major facilitator superfamily (MFS) profile domain-containing protein n=1 Tax=Pyrocoelia pectoralis TaxID=417401 RepID=A0AAN7V6J2_9COLE
MFNLDLDHSNPLGTQRNVRYLQYISAFCAGILQVSQFVNLAWGSPTVPLLLAKDSPIGRPLTYDEVSWMLSIIYAGIIIGSVLLLLLFDRLGPKSILMVGAALTIISWILLGLAKSFAMLIIGRVIAGIGDGISFPCISIYICEIASKDIRGRLGAIPVLIGIFGNVFIFGAGPYLGYQTLIISCAIFPSIFLILFFFMPNSPYYLIRRGRKNEAKTNLMRLLGSNAPFEVEISLKEIEDTVRRETEGETLMQLLLSPNFRKSLLIVFVAHNIINFCGLTFISPYLQVILASSGISLSKELTSVIYGLVQVPAVILSGILMDKVGRKPLFCVSSLGASVTLIIEGVYIYHQDVKLGNLSFVPVVCLTLYKFFISFGILHLPYFIVGELFTTSTKKVGSFIVTAYSSIVVFGSIKIFGSMFSSWGFDTLCWIFGSVCFIGVLFSLFMLPETKGRSFDEIQNNLSSKNTSPPEQINQ